jgi:hypothetical protein
MKSIIILILSTGILLLNNCAGKKNHSAVTGIHEKDAPMIVYGSPDCIHCMHFISELDSAGLTYDFRAVTEDTAMFNEMMRKIRSAEIKGYISYPVVDIHGKILVRPSMKELMESLK